MGLDGQRHGKDKAFIPHGLQNGLRVIKVKDLFSLYVLFSHFRPRDVPKGNFLLCFHKLCIHVHVPKTTFDRKCFQE